MTCRPRRIFAYSSGVLSWLRTIALLVVFSFMVLIVPFARARVYMCGRVVGWLPRAGLGACLPVSVRGLGGCVRSVLWVRGGRLRALGGRGVFPRFALT